ncbi:MAG TPA: 3'(2'),5'-bisphosphate nucleotidase CysQ [Pseudolabrys sp.]|nr:3'(2'),5'-bisphosphate nucleotidase CysQ [Pseudolabrys sp.]
MADTSEISPAEAARLMTELTRIVARASALIRAVSPESGHKLKADQSPVTVADEASETEILNGLARLLPGVPVVSEEMSGRQAPPKLGGSFILVDPLDGTREFIAGRDEYTVNVAIVTGGTPIAGVVSAPKQHKVWRGIVGRGAERLRMLADGADQAEPIRTRRWPAQNAVAVVSRSHLDPATQAFVARLGPVARDESGSAIKFCRLAEGAADVYPRLATTCEWDVAAGLAVVLAAGGTVTNRDGAPLTFGNAANDFRIPAFIAWGDPDKAKTIRA